MAEGWAAVGGESFTGSALDLLHALEGHFCWANMVMVTSANGIIKDIPSQETTPVSTLKLQQAVQYKTDKMCELCECMCLVLNDDCMEGCCMISRLCDILRCDIKPCCCCKGKCCKSKCCDENDEEDNPSKQDEYEDFVISQQPSRDSGNCCDSCEDSEQTNDQQVNVVSSQPTNNFT
ncbi:uncharacterized protein LOC134762705 [Penaeus indicus]|uniref:uncharacterized protein LOC134762705 n=1 Tax=Penaeus indicus TaxID=29960 RepID=UPI00300CEFDA